MNDTTPRPTQGKVVFLASKIGWSKIAFALLTNARPAAGPEGRKPKPISRAMQGGSELLHVDLQGNTKVLWKSAAQSSPGLPPPDGRYLAIYDSKLSMNIWLMENF
ncbi:MAG: hypothetical protein ACM34E_03655 [Acidobacteriota bacterium]